MINYYNKNKAPRSILLVDDDSFCLRLHSEIIQKANYTCVCAHNGQEAWEYLQQFPENFFVVLADRIMPKMHGLELFKKMQQLSQSIPLILLTGEATKEERLDALKQGIYDFLYKPICNELLLAILKKIKNKF